MARIRQLNLDQLNKELVKIDALQKQVADLHQKIGDTHAKVQSIKDTHAPIQFNTLTFTWTGGTTTLSWPAGAVVTKTGENVPVATGSITGLSASTYYWLAWNPTHQKMVAQVGLNGLLQIPDNVVICQVFTGTGAQTGVAGGGGSSSSGSDLCGARYKLF